MRRRNLLAAALPFAAAACSGSGSGSGTDRAADRRGSDEGGIGGTGRFAEGRGSDDGGIGGTGVFGSVTGLGSLRVNGLLLRTSAATDFETLGGAPVLPGDAVAAEGVPGDGAGHLVATRVAVFHPLVGPLERTADGSGWAVLGTRLLLAPDVPVRDGRDGLAGTAALRPGLAVAVSGLWRDEAVVATSLRLLDDAPATMLRGLLRAEGGGLLVGGTRVEARGVASVGAAVGRFVTVQGRPAGARGLVAEAFEERPLAVFSGRVSALSVEGFVSPNRDAPGYHLSGFGLQLDPSSPVPARLGVRQVLLGRYRDLFRVDQGLLLPADDEARRQALASAAAEAANARWLSRR